MREIKRDALIDETDVLLFDSLKVQIETLQIQKEILQELKKLTNKPMILEEIKEEIKVPIIKKKR